MTMLGFKRIMCVLAMVLVFICGGLDTPFASAKEPKISQQIIMFHDNVSREEIGLFIDEWKPLGLTVIKELPIINGLVVVVPNSVLVSDFASDPRIDRIESDRNLGLSDKLSGQYGSFIEKISMVNKDDYPWGILKLFEEPFNPTFYLDEHKTSRVPALVQLAQHLIEHRRIRIAVFDTGIHPKNKRIRRCLKGGIDLVNNNSVMGNKDPKRKAVDDSGHGTHVAGIIAATLDPYGKWGKRSGVELYSVKMLNHEAMGELSSVIEGLQWAIDNDIDIVNMSIGYKQDSEMIQRAVQYAYNAGIVMVASVGNRSNWDDSLVLSAEGGSAEGGSAEGGSAEGGSAEGGSAEGGSAEGGSAEGGSAEGGSAEGGSAEGGSAEGGSAEGGSAEGGSAEGGSAEGGSAEGGSAEGGSAEGGSAEGGSTENDAYEIDPLPLYSVMYPARYPEVIAVGASTSYGELAEFTCSGPEMDITAPGQNVVSLDITNGDVGEGLGVCSGTSQAAPHVTSAAAMMLALDPSLRSEEIQNILKETATGAGEMNLESALGKVAAEFSHRSEEDRYRKIFRELFRKQLQEKIRNWKGSMGAEDDID